MAGVDLTPEQAKARDEFITRVRAVALGLAGYLSAWLAAGAFAAGFLFSLGALAAWMVTRMLLALFGAAL